MQVEVLQTLGIVRDVKRPRFEFALQGGGTRTIDAPIVSLDDFGALWSDAFGERTPPSWRANTDETTAARITDRAVVISFTVLEKEPTEAIALMRSALADGRANRVVFDMRYCRGGDYSTADTMREALATPEVRDRLTVITGSGNISAASVLAQWLQRNTGARFVGEPPPTMVNPMLDEVTFTLPASGVVVHVPSYRWIFDAADRRRAMTLDTVVRDRGADFFRGVDTTLPSALR